MSYHRTHSILCVEDDPLLRHALVVYLTARGYRITTAGSVAQARDLSVRVRWSGFVCDQGLGDGTGLELLAWLRRNHPDVPAALLTGDASAEVANRCARDRVHYLRKPMDASAFEPFLERVDAYQRAPSYPSLQAMSVHIEASPREQELLRLALAERLRPFIRGRAGEVNAEPVAEVTLSAYWIDRFPVTNRRFRECMAAGVCAIRTSSGRNSIADPERDDYPVQGVSWEQAREFCEWDGRRLPTEAEIEKAGRGPAPRDQPYLWDGDAYRCDLLPIRSCGYLPDPGLSALGYVQDTYDALPGTRSYYGVEMLEGIGCVWAHDFFGEDYYADPSSLVDPQGPPGPGGHIRRGSRRSAYGDEARFRVTNRHQCLGPNTVRCARSE